MKTKFLLIPALLLGATALSGAAVALSHKNVARVAKAAELSPYTITDSMYEVAFLEQYMSSSSLDSYSYVDDKPLGGKNAIGGHYYGDGITTPTDVVTNLNSGVNETLQWKISFGRVRGKADPNRAYFQLESSASHNLKDSTAYPQADYPDEYAIANLFSSSYYHVSAMYTTTAIENIEDVILYWRSSYTKRAYLCFQVEGGSWTRYADINRNSDGKIIGNLTGTRGWDTYGYQASKSSSWASSPLKGATAKIAIACCEMVNKNGEVTEEGNFPVSAILINPNKAAVRYLNALSYQDHVCSSNGENLFFDLNKGQSDNVHNQDLFQLATERADGSFLADYVCAGTKTSEYYVLGLYNHLVTSIPALGSVKAASSNYFMNMTNNANVVIIVSVSIAAAAILGTGLFFGLRKRKHN